VDIGRLKRVILITLLRGLDSTKDHDEKARIKWRKWTKMRRYFAVILLYYTGMPKQFHLEVFQIAETFPARDVPFRLCGEAGGGRNVASGNEILPKLVGTADQGNLASLETTVVVSLVAKNKLDHESIVLAVFDLAF